MNVRADTPAEAAGSPVERRTLLSLLGGPLRGQTQSVGVLLVMLALFVATGLHSSLFWGWPNVKVLLMNGSFIGLAAMGTAILIITGNIDLSIGSLLGLTSVLAAIFATHMAVPLAFVCAILVGGLIGAVNGLVVWNVSTSPLIITLGSLTLIRGIVYIVTNGQAMTGMPNSFTDFGNSEPLGLPTPVWLMLAACAVTFTFLAFTKPGRHVYAIGGNPEASRAAGIRNRRMVIGAFLVNGLLVGLTGVLEASFYGSPDSTFGNGFELQVITGVIVGGVSFAGGEGGAVRALFGVLLLEVVSASVVSFGVDPNWANVITGSILILAVSLDQIVHRQRERYQKAMAMRERGQLVEEERARFTESGVRPT